MRNWGAIPIALSASPLSVGGAVNTAGSAPVTMLSGVTSHTKGPWTELFVSSPFNTTMLDLLVSGTATSGGNRHMLCDIAIGSSGNEVVIVPNIAIGSAAGQRRYTIPMWIAAGSRIAVRYQTTVPAGQIPIGAQAILHNTGGAQADTGSSAVAYGANLVASSGTPLTIPGAINTVGAWTQITASTSAAMRSLLISTQGPAGASWSTAPTVLVDVGYGGSGSEQVLVNGLSMSWGSTEMTDSSPITLPVNLPSGTRLVARYQASDIAQAPNIGLVGIS